MQLLISLQWCLIVTRYFLLLLSIITCKLIWKTPVGELIKKLYCIVYCVTSHALEYVRVHEKLLDNGSHFYDIKRKWGERGGGSGRWPGYVMSTKVIFRRAEVRMQSCLPLRFLVNRKNAARVELQTSDRGWPACGRLGRQISARTKTSARLKITFLDITYLEGWTGSLPLCPLFFSWLYLFYTSWVMYYRRAELR